MLFLFLKAFRVDHHVVGKLEKNSHIDPIFNQWRNYFTVYLLFWVGLLPNKYAVVKVNYNFCSGLFLQPEHFLNILLQSMQNFQMLYAVVDIWPYRSVCRGIIKRFKHMRGQAAFSVPCKAA